jgi:hypothetical protein
MSHRTTRAIQQDIEATRERIDRTAAELEDRVSLDHLGDVAMEKLRSSGARDFVDNLGRSLRDHPLPAVMTGIGMRWLMTAETRRNEVHDGNGHQTGERARELAHELGDRSKRVASKARHGAEELTDGLRDGWDKVQRGWDRTVQREPLLLGVLGLAAGVAMAAWAPATETEDELLGSTSDRLKRRAATRGRERAEDLRERAETDAAGFSHAHQPGPSTSEGTRPGERFDHAASGLASADVSRPGPLGGGHREAIDGPDSR